MKRGKSSIWPMEYILGGIFVAAALVLLVYGLQSRSPRDTAQAPSATEDTATRSESSVRLPAPEQIADIAAENPVQQAGDRNGTIASAEPALAAEGALQGPEPVSFAEAESHFHAADFSQAAEGFRSYVLAHPGNPWGHYMLGLSEWRGGDAAAAEGALQRALEIDPGHAKAMVNLGRVLLDLDRPGDAIAVLDEAVAIDPASATAHRVRARALHDLGRSTDAIAAYRGALGLDPADAWSLNNLGLILIEAERFEDALPVLALAERLEGDVAVFRNNLGVALERCGHGLAAAEAYAAALALDEGHEKARVSLARVGALPAGDAAPELAVLAEACAAALADGCFPWEESVMATNAGEGNQSTPAEEPTLLSEVQPVASDL